ncbi:hypothetical protein EPN81_04055 [Patescibacteria group bacterium]|nr:MAG: hypothetical protein EPN81_04055 [Patescibacteria group bacterium]
MINQPSAKSTARDVFSYLLLIAMFIVGVVSFLALIFQYVNIQFPDQLDYWWREGALQVIRGAISALVVSWPVVIFMSIFIGKDLRTGEGKQNIWIRKWLLHLMLFVSAIAIIIDLITLINTFLDGEITTRFILKVLAVLIVAIAVFWYYLWELKRDPTQTTRVTMWAATASSVVIVVAIVASLFIVGSPSKQRDVRLDQDRVSGLQTIQSSLVEYWRTKEVLPENLTALEDDISGYRNPVDPESGEAYEYFVTGELSFQLCATFTTETDESSKDRYTTPVMYDFGYLGGNFDIWSHAQGRVCFDRTIDPDRVKDGYVY